MRRWALQRGRRKSRAALLLRVTRAVAACGGISALVASITKHPSDATIVGLASCALGCIGNHADTKAAVVSTCRGARVADVLRAHAGNRDVKNRSHTLRMILKADEMAAAATAAPAVTCAPS